MKKIIYKFILFILFIFQLTGCKSQSEMKEYAPSSNEWKGLELFKNMACDACHSIDGSLKLGPTMKAQFGKEILHVDGSIQIIDEDYIEESLLYPLKHIAEGYTPIMPSYKPVLSEQDIKYIIAYIRSLK